MTEEQIQKLYIDNKALKKYISDSVKKAGSEYTEIQNKVFAKFGKKTDRGTTLAFVVSEISGEDISLLQEFHAKNNCLSNLLDLLSDIPYVELKDALHTEDKALMGLLTDLKE